METSIFFYLVTSNFNHLSIVCCYHTGVFCYDNSLCSFPWYLFKFFIPQRASISSSASPIENESDGIPSIIKLITLPNAKPIIKSTFEIVAIRQWDGLKIPINQSTTIPRYNPIVALKTCFKSIDSTLKSKSFGRMLFGNKP